MLRIMEDWIGVESQVYLKCCFPFVTLPYKYIIIAPADVKFGKIPYTFEFVQKFLDKG